MGFLFCTNFKFNKKNLKRSLNTKTNREKVQYLKKPNT